MDKHINTENNESPAPITLYSIGHSNHSLAAFLELLAAFHIKTLVDIRSYPYSTKMTQFDMEYLEHQLLQHEITYHWFQDLGGFRKGLGEQSPNHGLKNDGFRAYADYMQSKDFHHAAVHDDGLPQGLLQSRQGQMLEFVPFGDDHQRVGSLGHLVGILA